MNASLASETFAAGRSAASLDGQAAAPPLVLT